MFGKALNICFCNGDLDDPLLFSSHTQPGKDRLFLEEAGLPYETVPVDTSKGEQHGAAFRAVNPNGKVPAIVDTDGLGAKERVFDLDRDFDLSGRKDRQVSRTAR